MKAEKLSILERFLPQEISTQFSITKAYVVKIGFFRVELEDSIDEAITSEDNALFDKYLNELYSVLSTSPHIMDISPKREELILDSNKLKEGIGFRLTWGENTIAISEFLRMRVVLPKRKSEELYKLFSTSWCPEQFSIYFDGGIFLAVSEIDKLPVMTDIGQVAREFLNETLKTSKLWKAPAIVGPTPLHPEIYILTVAANSPESQTENKFPLVFERGGDLLIVVPESLPIAAVVNDFLEDSEMALISFYESQSTRLRISNRFASLDQLNRSLSEALAKYFRQKSFFRLFGTVAGNIRRLLSDMHLQLQEISTLDLLALKHERDAINHLQRATFLGKLSEYFKTQMEPYKPFDINAQHTIMNFAAQETSNLIVVQATLLAAFIGAIIGGIITVVAQFLLSGN